MCGDVRGRLGMASDLCGGWSVGLFARKWLLTFIAVSCFKRFYFLKSSGYTLPNKNNLQKGAFGGLTSVFWPKVDLCGVLYIGSDFNSSLGSHKMNATIYLSNRMHE